MDVGNCLTECVFIVVSPSASRSLEANLTSAQLTLTSLSSIPDPSALSREGGRLWSSEASAVCTLGWRQKMRSFIRFQRYYPPERLHLHLHGPAWILSLLSPPPFSLYPHSSVSLTTSPAVLLEVSVCSREAFSSPLSPTADSAWSFETSP